MGHFTPRGNLWWYQRIVHSAIRRWRGIIKKAAKIGESNSGEKTTRNEGTRAFGDCLSSASFAQDEYGAKAVVEMYLTPATLYALRLSFHQGAVHTALRRNAAERNVPKSAFVLATVGLSMSMFSVKKMLSSKPRRRL
ncbi:uncharacterized protein LOC143208957 [Lasioglossum baleicum]|uniref:uncharacterized protein LOC143208957 n=1 Tax=Lasioglossum baleicum TaxID=434251 RepID=UPI003FCEB129